MTIPTGDNAFHIEERPDGFHLVLPGAFADLLVQKTSAVVQNAISYWNSVPSDVAMVADGKVVFLSTELANKFSFTKRTTCPLILFEAGDLKNLDAPEELSRYLLNFIKLQKLLDEIGPQEGMTLDELLRSALKKIAGLPGRSFDTPLLRKLILQKDTSGRTFLDRVCENKQTEDIQLIKNVFIQHDGLVYRHPWGLESQALENILIVEYEKREDLLYLTQKASTAAITAQNYSQVIEDLIKGTSWWPTLSIPESGMRASVYPLRTVKNLQAFYKAASESGNIALLSSLADKLSSWNGFLAMQFCRGFIDQSMQVDATNYPVALVHLKPLRSLSLLVPPTPSYDPLMGISICLSKFLPAASKEQREHIFTEALDELCVVYAANHPRNDGIEPFYLWLAEFFNESTPEIQQKIIDAVVKTKTPSLPEMPERMLKEEAIDRDLWFIDKFVQASPHAISILQVTQLLNRVNELDQDPEFLTRRYVVDLYQFALSNEFIKWLDRSDVSVEETQEIMKIWNTYLKDSSPLDGFMTVLGDLNQKRLVQEPAMASLDEVVAAMNKRISLDTLMESCAHLEKIFAKTIQGKALFATWHDRASALMWFVNESEIPEVNAENYQHLLKQITFLQTTGTKKKTETIAPDALKKRIEKLVSFMNEASEAVRSEIAATLLKSDSLSIVLFLESKPPLHLDTWDKMVTKAYQEGTPFFKKRLADCMVPMQSRVDLMLRVAEAETSPEKARDLFELFQRMDIGKQNLLGPYYVASHPEGPHLNTLQYVSENMAASARLRAIFVRCGEEEFFEALCEKTNIGNVGLASLETPEGREAPDFLDRVAFMYAHDTGKLPSDRQEKLFERMAAIYNRLGNFYYEEDVLHDFGRFVHDPRKIIQLVLARSPKLILAFFKGEPRFTDLDPLSQLVEKALRTEGVMPLEEEERMELSGLLTALLPPLVIDRCHALLEREVSEEEAKKWVEIVSRLDRSALNPLETYYNSEMYYNSSGDISLSELMRKFAQLKAIFAKAPEGDALFVSLQKKIGLPERLLDSLPDAITANNYQKTLSQIAFLCTQKFDFCLLPKMDELAKSFQPLLTSADPELKDKLLQALRKTGPSFISHCRFRERTLNELFAMEEKYPGLLPWDIFKEKEYLDEKIGQQMDFLHKSPEESRETIRVCAQLEKLGFNPLQIYYQPYILTSEFSDQTEAVFAETAKGKVLFDKLRRKTYVDWARPLIEGQSIATPSRSDWEKVLTELAFAQTYDMGEIYRDKTLVDAFLKQLGNVYPTATDALQTQIVEVVSRFPAEAIGRLLFTAPGGILYLDGTTRPWKKLLPLIHACSSKEANMGNFSLLTPKIKWSNIAKFAQTDPEELYAVLEAMGKLYPDQIDLRGSLTMDPFGRAHPPHPDLMTLYMRSLEGDLNPIESGWTFLFRLSNPLIRDRLIKNTPILQGTLSETLFANLITRLPEKKPEITRAALTWQTSNNEVDMERGLAYERLESDLLAIPDLDIKTLLELFKKVNFTRPEDPFYCHPNILKEEGEDKFQYSVESIKKSFTDLITKYIPESANALAVPKEKELRKLFYEQLSISLQHLVVTLQETLSAEGKTEREIADDRQAFVRAIVEMAMASFRCGSRWRDEALNQVRILKKQAPQDLEQWIRFDLASYRSGIAEALFPNDIHGLGTFMKMFGKELNLPGYEFASETMEQDKAKQQKPVFLAIYNPAHILARCIDKYHNEALFKERVCEKISEQASTESTHALKKLYREDPKILAAKAAWKSFLVDKQSGSFPQPFFQIAQKIVVIETPIEETSDEELEGWLEGVCRARQNPGNRIVMGQFLNRKEVKEAFFSFARERSEASAKHLQEVCFRCDRESFFVGSLLKACSELHIGILKESIEACLDRFLKTAPPAEKIEKELDDLIDDAIDRDSRTSFLSEVENPMKLSEQILLILEEYHIIKKKPFVSAV